MCVYIMEYYTVKKIILKLKFLSTFHRWENVIIYFYFIQQNQIHIGCKNANRGNDNLTISVENPIMNMT